MATASDVLNVARSQIGYVEQGGPDGKSGNLTKYWAELMPSFEGQSWCAAFVSWVFKHAGAPLPAIDHDFGYTYCPDAVNYAKAHGLWDESGHYSPGDIVLYCFDGSGVADHTGIVESDDGRVLVAIEGNTTPQGLSGSQSNGGCVARKIHPHGPTVLGVLKTASLLSNNVSGEDDDLMKFELVKLGDAIIAISAAGGAYWHVPTPAYAEILMKSPQCATPNGPRPISQGEHDALKAISDSVHRTK